nr:putative calcium-binding protein cml27 [Quercus suber]
MKCSVEDCDRMIRSIDSDGDENVNFEEFQKMMTTAALGYSCEILRKILWLQFLFGCSENGGKGKGIEI